MAEDGEPKVSAAYRELGAEEPPRALDEAILAAARREAGARPGSPGRAAPQRWFASLAAAAVLVLAVAVTLTLQPEQPGIEDVSTSAGRVRPAPAAKRAVPAPSAAPAAQEPAPQAKEAVAESRVPQAVPPLKAEACKARRSEREAIKLAEPAEPRSEEHTSELQSQR